MMQGRLITLEGVDGAGKSTQLLRIEQELKAHRIPYLLTREPGGTSIGEAIRKVLLSPDFGEMAPETEALLYAASRAQHVREVIRPALQEGRIVLCDRYYDSSLVYQGIARHLGIDWIKYINERAMDGLMPDRTLVFLLSPAEGLRRAQQSHTPDRLEGEKMAFHQVVYEGYVHLAQQDGGNRIVPIDAAKPVEEVWEEVKKALAFLWE